MTLTPADYIRRSGILDWPIKHAWNDADPEFAYTRMDDNLQHRISAMSDRAALTFSAGCAEWVAWRMVGHTNDTFLLERIEATYAAVIDWRYMRRIAMPSRHQWQGSVRGPLWAAANLLDQMIGLLKGGEFASPESVCLSNLVRSILPDPKPFKEWRRLILKRLAERYPINRQQPLGIPVPREALDPDVDLTPDQAAAAITRFIEELRRNPNPHLGSLND
jgi:hypothetical protein